MVSASLANITKTSGTNTNVFLNIDDWTEVSKEEKPKVYLNFMTPPLGLVLAMREGGKSLPDIHETLVGLGKNSHIKADHVVSVQHQAQAAEILNYFSKKHTIRRLKGEHISNFMLVVDRLCENRNRIDEEHVKVLVTLPKFYEQNLQLESIMKSAKTIDRSKSVLIQPFDEELIYAGEVHITSSRHNANHYFWKTDKNHLVRIIVNAGDMSNSVWKMMARHGKMKVKSTYAGISNIQGYDYGVYHLSSDAEVDLA